MRNGRFIVAVLTIGGCGGESGGESGDSSASPLGIGESLLVEGRVTDIDAKAMAVDGDGLIFVQSETNGDLVVHIPARERLCRAQGLDNFSAISVGDTIRALGNVTGERDVTVCTEEAHFLKKLEQKPSTSKNPSPAPRTMLESTAV